MEESVASFAEDATLGRELTVFVVIKGFHQREQNRFYRKRLTEGGPLGAAEHREYRGGTIFITKLDGDVLTDTHMHRADFRADGEEPNWVESMPGGWLLVFGNHVDIYSIALTWRARLSSPWFGQLHTVFFSRSRRTFLVCSTGFETILEFDESGVETWRWNAWEKGYFSNHFGDSITFCCTDDSVDVLIARNKILTSRNGLPFGVPTRQQACHISCAMYDRDLIYATLASRGEIIAISRETGNHRTVMNKLSFPHGPFRIDQNTLGITDTQRGVLRLLNNDFMELGRLSFSQLPSVVDDRQDTTEWLQNVSHVAPNVLCAVDTHRSAFHLLDISNRLHRTIKVPENWSVQLVKPYLRRQEWRTYL